MKIREDEDKINDFGRDPIGEGWKEQVSISMNYTYKFFVWKSFLKSYNRGLRLVLNNKMDDASLTSEIGERQSKPGYDMDENTKRKRPKLEDLTRFTMVKRIWW